MVKCCILNFLCSMNAEIYHQSSIFAASLSTYPSKMTTDNAMSMQIAVCKAPDGSGLNVEHISDFLPDTSFDDCAPHLHYFYEILWFQEGAGKHTMDFMEYDIQPNTIFFISPGQVHHFDHTQGYKGVSIKMCTDFMKDEADTNNTLLKYSVFHTFDTAPFYRVNNEVAHTLQHLVQQMEEEMKYQNCFGNTDILKSLIRIFLIQVLRHGEQNSELPMSNLKPAHILFIKFRKLVEQEYKHMHTVQEYADRLNVAQRTLHKCVNECSHTSPLSFINERIMLEAKRLVKYSNLMIKEIAFDLGFDDPSYFIKLFKKKTGYLPSDFRELD